MADLRSIYRRNYSYNLKVIFIISLFAISLIAISGCAYAHEMGGNSDTPPPHWPYHAFFVSTGLIFMTAGMITARSMKGKRWWLKAHKIIALLGASLALIGFFIAAYLVSTYLDTYFLRELHAYLGIGAVLLVVFTPIIGFMQFRLRDKRIKAIHRWSGRTTLVIMLANILAGLQMIIK